MRINGSSGPIPSSADLYEWQAVGRRANGWPDTPSPDGSRTSPPALGAIGPLEIRLARSNEDIKRVQKLRYEVFYKHGLAAADVARCLTERDLDDLDSICDHLMV